MDFERARIIIDGSRSLNNPLLESQLFTFKVPLTPKFFFALLQNVNDLEKFKTKIKKIHKILTLLWTFRACSIGINRFNLNQFWLIWLRCSNRTLFWLFLPFLVETRFGLGRVITRLSPCNAGLRELRQDGGNSWSCCPSSCRFRSYRRRNSIGIRRRRTWRISAAFSGNRADTCLCLLTILAITCKMLTTHENWRPLICQRTLPIVFNHFNQVLSWLKKLINQTNQKRFFPNRTRKNPTNQNQNNQKRLIPIEHALKVAMFSFTNVLWEVWVLANWWRRPGNRAFSSLVELSDYFSSQKLHVSPVYLLVMKYFKFWVFNRFRSLRLYSRLRHWDQR